MLEWNDSLSVQNITIDNQHKQLVSKLNDFLNAYDNKKSNEKLMEIFKFLSDYTKVHFRDEENLMLKYKYPGYDAQKKEHTKFINDLSNYEKDLSENKSTLVLKIKTNQMLVDWLVNHIGKVDKALGVYLQGRA
ncbi:MAG: bacteriohemerythrin [Bacillota bacterium]|nr:bacteriohemerythrin [Bacillota bacterium]